MKKDKFACFTMTVDSKLYGPFLWKYRSHAKVKKLEKLCGVSLSKELWLETGWQPFTAPSPPRAKADKTTPLLEGIGFVPVIKYR